MKIMFLKAITQLELWFLQLVDSVMKLFNIFAGLEGVGISGEGDDINLLNYFLSNETVLTVLFILVALSAGVASILTIVAVIKNMISMKRKMGKIVAQYLTSVFTSVLVGAILILAIYLSSNILILVNKSFTGVAGTDNIGTQVLDITASNSYTDTSKAIEDDNKSLYYWIVAEDSVQIGDNTYSKGDIITYNERLKSTKITCGSQQREYKDCFGLTNNWMVVLNGENFKQYSDVTHLTPDIMLGDYNRDGWPLDFETEPDSSAKTYWTFQGKRTDYNVDQYPVDTWKAFVYEDPYDGRNVWCIGIPTTGSEYKAEADGVKYSEFLNTKIEASVKPKDGITVNADGEYWIIGNTTTTLETAIYPSSEYTAFIAMDGGKYYWYLGKVNGNVPQKTAINNVTYGDLVEVKYYTIVGDIRLKAATEAASPETDATQETYNITGQGTKHYGLVNYDTYEYVIGLFAAVMLIIVFCVAIMGLIARLFDLVFLLLSSPLITATIPLDEGAKFKLWRETAISKTLLAYGTVLGVNIYCLLLPIISNIAIPDQVLLTLIIKTLLIVVGALTISNSSLLLARILGTEAAEGRQAMHGMAQLVGGIATTGRLIKGAGNMVMGTRNPFTGRREFGMAQYGASALRTAGAAVGATAMGVGKLLGGNQFTKGVENTSALIRKTGSKISQATGNAKNALMNNGGIIGSAVKGAKNMKENVAEGFAEIGDIANFGN